MCGTVVSLGEDVTALRVGQRVFGTALSLLDSSQGEGGCAELCKVSAADVYTAPDGVDPHVCAGFEINYGTTWHALCDIARVKRGETVSRAVE